MRGSGAAGDSATTCRAWAESLGSILERDRDTLARSVQLDRGRVGAGQPDLTMRRLLAPYLLVEAPRRIGGLARELSVTTSSVSGLVGRLVVARLVEREHGSTDRRPVVSFPTDRGRRELERFLQVGRVRLERVLFRISAVDLRVVHRALDLLGVAARGVAAEPRAT
jgi:DNA-binding MarR family transcriptional regulator